MRTFLRRSFLITAGLAVLVVLVVGVWWVTHREESRGMRAAVLVASEFEQIPVATRIARWGSDEPEPTDVREVGGLPATLVRPGAGHAAPAMVLLVPEGTTAAEGADVVAVQRGLARAGASAWAFRTPDLGASMGTEASQERIERAVQEIARDTTTKDRHVALIAVGPQASQALVAAARPDLRAAVRGVVAVQPVADLRGAVQLAVTGITIDADGTQRQLTEASPARLDAARALVAVVRTHVPEDAPSLVTRIVDRAERSTDPIGELRSIPARLLTDDLRPIRAVLDASDVASFTTAWNALPADLRAEADAVSPSTGAADISARVLLVTPTDDSAWPGADADRLHAALDDSRRLETSLFGPGSSDVDITFADARRLGRELGWWLDQ